MQHLCVLPSTVHDLSDLFILDPFQGNKKEQSLVLYCEMQPYTGTNGKWCRFRINDIGMFTSTL